MLVKKGDKERDVGEGLVGTLAEMLLMPKIVKDAAERWLFSRVERKYGYVDIRDS